MQKSYKIQYCHCPKWSYTAGGVIALATTQTKGRVVSFTVNKNVVTI